MENYIIARVILMPEGDIHIAYSNRQAYYCTPKALLLLLSDPLNFLEKGALFLTASTYILNKRSEPLEEIQGLTLLSVYSDKRLVCEFPELFQLLYSPYITAQKMASENLFLNISDLIDEEIDEKKAMLHLYMAYTQSSTKNSRRRRNSLGISAEAHSKIVSEIINTTTKHVVNPAKTKANFSLVVEAMKQEAATKENEEIEAELVEEQEANGSELVTFQEFADLKGVLVGTVYKWKEKEKLTTAIKDEKRGWLVDRNEVVVDRRPGKTIAPLKDGSGRKFIQLKGRDYKSVQLYIEERNLVTELVRPYVRTYEEAKYYEKHYYHEVKWECGSAMIIDINPDYFSEADGKTNRQLIADGESPVVPGSEQYKFHLHHIGQKKDSPLAIIPGYDHNDEKLYSIFHPGKTAKEDLHGKEFEKQKREFWATYMQKIDEYGGFKKIPYLNPKHKRGGKK